jgi:hypothetical protein
MFVASVTLSLDGVEPFTLRHPMRKLFLKYNI